MVEKNNFYWKLKKKKNIRMVTVCRSESVGTAESTKNNMKF